MPWRAQAGRPRSHARIRSIAGCGCANIAVPGRTETCPAACRTILRPDSVRSERHRSRKTRPPPSRRCRHRADFRSCSGFLLVSRQGPSDIIIYCSGAFLQILMQKHSKKFAAMALALSLSACSLLQEEQVDDTKGWSSSKLYSEARDELKSGNYEKSVTYFEKLESRYPFGPPAPPAPPAIAYAHYKADDQAQALAAVERFIKLHPDRPNVDNMYYLRSLLKFNDRVSMIDFLEQ